MADLSDIQAAGSTKIVGSDSVGLENTPVQATTAGGLHANLRDNSGAETGVVANPLRVDPTGTTVQPVKFSDVLPATQSITAQDTSTSTFVGANGQNFYTGTPTAGSVASFALASAEAVNVMASLLGGGGTLVVEVSMDGGTFWVRPQIVQPGTTNYAASFTSPFQALMNTAGVTNIRVRAISAWTGTATIRVVETTNPSAVSITDSALPVGAATAANQATVITSVQILDDVPTAQNGALVKGTPIMGHLDDTATVAATEDAVAAVRITAQRAMHVSLRTPAGADHGTTASPIGTRIGDGTDTAGVTANGDLKVASGLHSGGVHGALSIPTTGTPVEAKVGGARLTGRKQMIITATTTGLWWGYDNTVTIASGQPLANGQTIIFDCDPDGTFQIWLVGNATLRTARISESP